MNCWNGFLSNMCKCIVLSQIDFSMSQTFDRNNFHWKLSEFYETFFDDEWFTFFFLLNLILIKLKNVK